MRRDLHAGANAGTHTIAGSYTATGVHANSTSSGFAVTVATRSTSTTVTCSRARSRSTRRPRAMPRSTTRPAGPSPNPTAPSTSAGRRRDGQLQQPDAAPSPVPPTRELHSTSSVTYTPTTGASVHTVQGDYNEAVERGPRHELRRPSPSPSPSGTHLDRGRLRRRPRRDRPGPAPARSTVTDTDAGTESDPDGLGRLRRTGAGERHLQRHGSCALVSDLDALTYTSSCSVTYTPDLGRRHAHRPRRLQRGLGRSTRPSFDDRRHHRHRADHLDRGRLPDRASRSTRAATCTVTVTDTDAGTKSDPTGSVDFAARAPVPAPSAARQLHPRPMPSTR